MELRHLATFRTLATTLNFTQTAALLGYVQSSVSAQIQELEAELGVLLFDRLNRRVILTDEGQRLLVIERAFPHVPSVWKCSRYIVRILRRKIRGSTCCLPASK